MRILRPARADDATRLCEAEREIVAQFDNMLVSEPDELHASAFRDRILDLADGSGRFLVAEQDGEVVAHACLWPMGLRRVAHVLRLEMCVHLGHWRRGHGEALLRALLAWARDESTTRKVELMVRAENPAAIGLYRKLGFVEEGRLRQRVRLRSGRLIDDLSMGLILAEHGGPPLDRP